jgi:Transcriptional regulator
MVESSSPSRNRASTEARILTAAEQVLVERGFGQLNVQTAAEGAGCDRKLVYRYFDGLDGLIARLAAEADQRLRARLDRVSTPEDISSRDFTRIAVQTWLHAIRNEPLTLALMAWGWVEDSPQIRALEADRARVLQDWMRARRPRLRAAPTADTVALTVVLTAAVQGLALADRARGGFSGLELNETGWARIEAALDRLTRAWPEDAAT